MNSIQTIMLPFANPEISYMIKFGEGKHLEKIQNGIARFKHISYYQRYEARENNKIIGDKFEGLESIVYPLDITQVTISFPTVNQGSPIDFTNLLAGPICDYPDRCSYILCLSCFSLKNVIDNNIFDNKYLEEKYDSVLLFLDTTDFIKNIQSALQGYGLSGRPIDYLDYSKSKKGLDIFSKSSEYAWQKEIRISVEYTRDENDIITVIDDDTIEVVFEKVQSVIIPIKEFKERFSVDETGNCFIKIIEEHDVLFFPS